MTEAASSYWDAWQRGRQASQMRFVDWGDHPTILKWVYQTVFGSPEIDFFQYFKRSHPEFSQQSALSLCCGDGGFERALLEHNVFAHITGMDIAPSRVTAAQGQRGTSADRLHFVVGDVNAADFGDRTYDIVFAKAALHHVENLEGLVHGVTRCLRPGGRLVAIDFFGPTRFQWTAPQIQAANWFIQNRVPPDLRRRQDGSVYSEVVRPTVDAMIALDPSEAVRSGDLDAVLRAHFDLLVELPLGGTLLSLIFYGDIINNFDPLNPEHNRILEEAFLYEREHLQTGLLTSDFRLLIAAPRC